MRALLACLIVLCAAFVLCACQSVSYTWTTRTFDGTGKVLTETVQKVSSINTLADSTVLQSPMFRANGAGPTTIPSGTATLGSYTNVSTANVANVSMTATQLGQVLQSALNKAP